MIKKVFHIFPLEMERGTLRFGIESEEKDDE
jgi:hypothetical protein